MAYPVGWRTRDPALRARSARSGPPQRWRVNRPRPRIRCPLTRCSTRSLTRSGVRQPPGGFPGPRPCTGCSTSFPDLRSWPNCSRTPTALANGRWRHAKRSARPPSNHVRGREQRGDAGSRREHLDRLAGQLSAALAQQQDDKVRAASPRTAGVQAYHAHSVNSELFAFSRVFAVQQGRGQAATTYRSVEYASPSCRGGCPGGQRDGAAGVMDVLVRASAARSVLELDELGGVLSWKANEEQAPRRVPVCGSMPSVKEYPRRRSGAAVCRSWPAGCGHRGG